jgi:hypothetical protein
MILLLTDTITPRLKFIARFIFNQNFGVDFSITTDKKEFEQSNLVRINYTTTMLTGDLVKIPVAGLLFEKNIDKQNIETFEINGFTAFFKSEKNDSGFPFDILSATFYLITRYEEYVPHTKDTHGRYDHHQSLATKSGFLKIPLINKWLQFFANFIQDKFLAFKIKPPAFAFLPTFDVDIAFEWQHKGLLKNTARLSRLFFRQDHENISEGFKILSGKKRTLSIISIFLIS